jgi:hypothetical protein
VSTAETRVETPEHGRTAERVSIRDWLALTALLGVALGLRLWGGAWGLPGDTRYYPYHPDETVLLHAVCSVNPLWGDWAPSFYNYGSAFILLVRLAYDFTAPVLGWGAVPRFGEPFAAWVQDFAHLLLTGRVVAALLGTVSVWAAWAMARNLFGMASAWITALFLAVAPLPVMMAHSMTVDIPATAFATLALACSARGFRTGSGPWVATAAGWAGVAIGTKYSTAPVLVALFPALWAVAAHHGRRVAAVTLLGSGLAVPLAFLASTPGALLEPRLFMDHVAYELGRNREGQGLIFLHTPPAALYHALISLPVGLEWPLYLLCIGAVVSLALGGRRMPWPALAIPLSFAVLGLALLLPSERKFVRYVAPVLPALVGVLSGIDPRDAAATYLRERTSPRDIVALASDSYFYTPPLHPAAGCSKLAAAYGGPPPWDALPRKGVPELFQLADVRVLAPLPLSGALPLQALHAAHPLYVVVSDYEWEDPLRLARAVPGFRDGMVALMEELERTYRLEAVFRPRPRLAGFTWWRTGTPPHDWRYSMPEVRVYRRRS